MKRAADKSDAPHCPACARREGPVVRTCIDPECPMWAVRAKLVLHDMNARFEDALEDFQMATDEMRAEAMGNLRVAGAGMRGKDDDDEERSRGSRLG